MWNEYLDCQEKKQRQAVRTYEFVIHSVLDIVLRDGVFPINDLQLCTLLKWVLLETQQVEDASEGLRGTTENNEDSFKNVFLYTQRNHVQNIVKENHDNSYLSEDKLTEEGLTNIC